MITIEVPLLFIAISLCVAIFAGCYWVISKVVDYMWDKWILSRLCRRYGLTYEEYKALMAKYELK